MSDEEFGVEKDDGADGNKTPEKGLGDEQLDLIEKANIFELDEEKAIYKRRIEYIDPTILNKYETLQKVGKGAYGIVWKALEKQTKRVVAIKKIFDAFTNDTDAQRTFREIFLNLEMGGHANIVNIINLRKSPNNVDVYIIFEFMDADLHTVIRTGCCRDLQVRYIGWQILCSLRFIHSAQIIHRDIKPANFLINKACTVKLGDFGLARWIKGVEKYVDPVLTDYIATRWYRAPEVLLGAPKYDGSIDMWGFGCILVEIYNAQPLFPGSSTLNQLQRILEITGVPNEKDLSEIHSPLALSVFDKLVHPEAKKTIKEVIPTAPDEAIDLIEKCLIFRPSLRITAA